MKMIASEFQVPFITLYGKGSLSFSYAKKCTETDVRVSESEAKMRDYGRQLFSELKR